MNKKTIFIAKKEFAMLPTNPAHFPTGWQGRKAALKWLFTGKPPSPTINVPVTVGPMKVTVYGGGGGGGDGSVKQEVKYHGKN